MKWVIAAIATAAVAGAIWWGTRRDPVAHEAVDLGSEASSSAPIEEPSAPALAIGSASTRPVERARVGASIIGTVRQGGRPVSAQVEVRLLRARRQGAPSTPRGMPWFDSMLAAPLGSTEPVATAMAGDDGRFQIEGLAAGTYDVLAVSKGARGSTAVSLPADGGRVEANVSVSAGAESLRGRVVRKDGRPWQGQVVVERIMPSGSYDAAMGKRSQVCAVDAEGRFVATHLEAGSASVSAIVVGSYRAGATGVPVPFAGEYVLTVDATTVLARGKVVSDADGAPISGASVYSSSWGRSADLSMLLARATSDAEGRFEVPVLSTIEGSLYVMATGFARTTRSGFAPLDGQTIEVRLARGATIVGRSVRDVDGSPVADVQVYAVHLAGGEVLPADPVTTDGAGRFEIPDLGAGDVMVYGQGAGYFTVGQREASTEGYNPLTVSLVAGKTTSVELRMLTGSRMSGKVVDSNGRPVPGAVVTAMGERLTRGVIAPPAPAASATDGTFVVESLLPGVSITLTAAAPGFAQARAGPFMPSESEVRDVELRFSADRRVDVLVVEEGSAAPVPGARVSGMVSTPLGGLEIPAAWTGPDGKAKLGPVPPGESNVNVDAEGYARGMNTRILEEDTTVTIRLARAMDVFGRVLMPDLSPAVGVLVSMNPFVGTTGRAAPETTGADGSFRFRGLGSGTVMLMATLYRDDKSWNASIRTEVGATDIQIVLVAPEGKEAASYALNVRVVDAAGHVVPRAQVRFLTTNSSHGTSLIDGRVTFQVGEERENMAVEVWAARGNDGLPLALGPTRVAVADGATDVEIRMEAASSIDGVVKTKDGVGVKGALVQAFAVERPGAGSPFGTGNALSFARTDAEGKFRLAGLGADDYSLSVQPPSELAPLVGVTAKGGSSGVELVLQAGTNVTLTVLDPEGTPLAGVNVSATLADDMASRWRGGSVQTDAKGQVRLLGLDASAAYQLEVSLRREDVLGVFRQTWKPVDETIRLTRVYTVRGFVRDLGGRLVPGASVQWRPVGAAKDDEWQGTESKEDGTFLLIRLPAGRLTLRAFVGDEDLDEEVVESSRETTVVAGAKDVVLIADVGLELVVRVENWPADGTRLGTAQLITMQDRCALTRSQGISQTGVAKFRGMKSGTDYTLWIPPGPDGLSCLRTGVRPGPDLTVRLVPGKSISGRVVAPEGVTAHSVSAQQDSTGLSSDVEVGPDGRFELKGLPEGRWMIRAWGRSKANRRTWDAQGEATTGGTIDLELKEPK